MDLHRHNRFFTVASVFAAFVLQPLSVFGDAPGNDPPGTPDCTPDVDTVWDPIDPSYGTHQVPQETNRTYCADGSLARIYGDIYHYQLFKEFEVTDYPSDSSCPADTRDATGNVEGRGGYIQVDRDVELPGSPGINGSVCGGSGDDDDDSGDDDDDGGGGTGTNCYTLSESARDVTADNFCNKYYTPRVYDDDAVTELPNKYGLNILYEVVYEWIPRRGFTAIGYVRPESPEDHLTYNTRTYTREISSGCVEGNGSGQSKYEYKPTSWDYCGTFTGYTHRIPSNGVYQEGLSGQSPDGLSEWRVNKHSYGGGKSFNVKYTTTYSDPYTSSAFRSDAVSDAPAFNSVFSRATTYSGNISASLNLTHSHLYYRKVKFKFKWGDEVENEDRYPVEYFVIFTPEDDPSTEDVDESEDVELVSSVPVRWNGKSAESEEFEIDPGAIHTSKDGNYRLVRIDITTDLNNDGLINSSDTVLEFAGEDSSANTEDVKLGTEFLFENDTISNGIWDKSDPNAPENYKTDDDVDRLSVSANYLYGEDIWFELSGTRPNAQGYLSLGNWSLRFYRTSDCEEEISLPINLADNSVNLSSIYVRAEGALPEQMNHDLKLYFGDFDKNIRIEGDAVKYAFVKGFGDSDYFLAARDYMYENNARTFRDAKNFGSTPYVFIVYLDNGGVMTPFDAYDHQNESAIAKGISEVASLNPGASVIINGNFVKDITGVFTRITTRCIGEFVDQGSLISPPSDLMLEELSNPSWGYVGVGSGYSFLNGRQVSSYSSAPPTNTGIGGLRLDFNNGAFNSGEGNVNIGIYSEPTFSEFDDIIFIAMSAGNIGSEASAVKASSITSRVQEMFILDGSSSIGLTMKDPGGEMVTYFQGSKHTIGFPYYINTYLVFNLLKPR
jgi:hypothetical protein